MTIFALAGLAMPVVSASLSTMLIEVALKSTMLLGIAMTAAIVLRLYSTSEAIMERGLAGRRQAVPGQYEAFRTR